MSDLLVDLGKGAASLLAKIGPFGVLALVVLGLLVWLWAAAADKASTVFARLAKTWGRLGRGGRSFVVSLAAALALISFLTVELLIYIALALFAGEWVGGQLLRWRHGLGLGWAWQGWAYELGSRHATRKLGAVLEATDGETARDLVRSVRVTEGGWVAVLWPPPKTAPGKMIEDLLGRRYDSALAHRFGTVCVVDAAVDNGDGTVTVTLTRQAVDVEAAARRAGALDPGVVEVDWVRP